MGPYWGRGVFSREEKFIVTDGEIRTSGARQLNLSRELTTFPRIAFAILRPVGPDHESRSGFLRCRELGSAWQRVR